LEAGAKVSLGATGKLPGQRNRIEHLAVAIDHLRPHVAPQAVGAQENARAQNRQGQRRHEGRRKFGASELVAHVWHAGNVRITSCPGRVASAASLRYV